MPQLPNPYEQTSSKPAARIPSRPISNTTTVTNTTVTPGTPRATRRPLTPLLDENTRPPTSPSTPRPSSTRRKLHNLFGIPLSPKKSSLSSSQNSSPRPSDVAIPSAEDDGFEDNDPTPKPSKGYSFQPHSPPHSPTPTTQTRLPMRNVSGSSTNTSSTSASSRLHKFLTGHKTSIHPRTDDVSGPLKRPSTAHRNNGSHSPPPDSKFMSPPPPRITREPPIPARPERPGPSNAFHEPPSSRRASVDNTMRGSSEGKGKEKEVLGGGSVNGHLRGPITASPRHSHRSTKHGSFDFERPGWSAGGLIKRSGSGGTTATGTTATTGTTFGQASLLDGIRESTMGPGMAGVGTLQREVSMKRAKEREDLMTRAKEEERRRRKTGGQQAGKKEDSGRTDGERSKDALGRHRSLQASPHGRSPDHSNSGHTEKSSSWGRAQGGIFRGKPKTTTIGLTHGPFSFEPAVPSPTWSVASNSRDASASVSWGGEKGRVSKDKERGEPKRNLDRGRGNEKPKEKVKEKERGREKEERERKSRNPVGDRPPVPVPVPMSIGHRSGLKGRSLDLGLELAWAPKSVREEALLPSSGFFARSLSTSSSLAGHSLKSKSGSSVNGRRGTIEEEKRSTSGVGREVAEVFKGALGPAGYATFKECRPFFFYFWLKSY